MNFDKFVDIVKNSISMYLPKEYENAEIKIKKIKKLNNSYLGMTVLKEGADLSPTINLNAMYKHYTEKPCRIATVMKEISGLIQEGTKEGFNVSSLFDYEKAKDRLYIRLTSAEGNADVLADVPYVKKEDLAITAHIAINSGGEGLTSTTVDNSMLKMYGITQEQLFQDAIANSEILFPVQIISMHDLMMDIYLDMLQDFENMGMTQNEIAQMLSDIERVDDGYPMTVVSNARRFNGAGAIFYPGVMEQLEKEMKGDYFVLPSSVHEVIIVPDNGLYDSKELAKMVNEVNSKEVPTRDQLSGNVYHYDAKNKVFELAEKFEARKKNEKLNAPKQEQTSQKTKAEEKKNHKGLRL